MAQVEEIGKVMSLVDMLRGNVKDLEARQMSGADRLKQRIADETNSALQYKKTMDYLVKTLEKTVNDAEADKKQWDTGVWSTDQSIKRLERQVDLLTKDLAALRKTALTAAGPEALG
jgi:uncharacterized coiled-coil protein SlyX